MPVIPPVVSDPLRPSPSIGVSTHEELQNVMEELRNARTSTMFFDGKFLMGIDLAVEENPEALMPVDLDHIGATSVVGSVVNHARKTGEWVVIVCSGIDSYLVFSRILSAVIPQDSKFSGRTALMDQGRVSVALLTEDVFIPSDTPFAVAFVGAVPKETYTEMAKWLTKASSQYRLQVR